VMGSRGAADRHIYTTISFTNEFRNVSVMLRVCAGLRVGWLGVVDMLSIEKHT